MFSLLSELWPLLFITNIYEYYCVSRSECFMNFILGHLTYPKSTFGHLFHMVSNFLDHTITFCLAEKWKKYDIQWGIGGVSGKNFSRDLAVAGMFARTSKQSATVGSCYLLSFSTDWSFSSLLLHFHLLPS